MDVYEAISRRMTIRDFSEKEIPMTIIRKILSAGLNAPTNDHLRQWEFILVQDQVIRKKLVGRIHAQQTEAGATALVNRWKLTDPDQRQVYIKAIPKQKSMLLNAAVLIIPCFFQPGPLLQPESLSALNNFASIWCCIENILITAAAEGIYGVTRIPFEPERKQMAKVLNIPAGYEVPCTMALGYPAEDAARMRQCSLSLDNKIHFNTW